MGGGINEANGNLRDSSGAAVRPPIAWALTVVAGLALDWLYALPFLPAAMPAGGLGSIVFLAGLALLIWAAATFRRAGTQVQLSRPTTTIVDEGPYRFTRNPIYIGMFLGLIGLAVAFDSLWLIILLAPFYLVIRYGVVAREEAYLERKFGDAYLAYKARIRRWL
ncbi:isoprenylcysteine carboxylmethyltransferase family protein [Rhizobium leguminosarum bv. viciae]|uniref:Isoprenylcysteine carboxylmethyltransferase family protein n=2 Tax=Rhizobium/Agrobacterium group TaxID=227290 RepID=A0A4R0BIL3_RHILV|nr:isoprenylcysteine carboxylmethyltransferase family protein [Rhizobium leguminosarum]NKL96234.1 isoprenylcysteine carboxylmethyltransferase family protein [Rhizobium leguminosarum bv. viciae]MBY5768621.1 isoprenylcysteine carboxylmethyltransferase family protein [Rhizobium leguminosarum]MBY5777313.1 isoprenylcysteine carboxylmethyltransferase family protein [Rhizobium leguminosarum]MBY5791096.1 isoprenylcysteine carboxylmethyltransferase family protein [Rhizobium leguminosarum]